MNVGRTVRRTIRPLWIAGLAATVWVNRAGVRSALGFGKKAPDGRGRSLDGAALDGPSLSLPAAGDTVTVRTTVATWARPRRRFHRRTTLPGSARTSAPAAAATTGQPSDLTVLTSLVKEL